jgi:hypothetical protein
LVDWFSDGITNIFVGCLVTRLFRFDTLFAIASLIDGAFCLDALFFVARLVDFAFRGVGFRTIARLVHLLLATDGNLLVDGVEHLLFASVVLSFPDGLFDDFVFDTAIARFAEQSARHDLLVGTVVVTGRAAVTGVCLRHPERGQQGQNKRHSNKAIHSQVPQLL